MMKTKADDEDEARSMIKRKPVMLGVGLNMVADT